METMPDHKMPGQPRNPRRLKSPRHESDSLFPNTSDRVKALAKTTKKFEAEPVIQVKPMIDKLINTVLSAEVSRRNHIINDVAANVQLAINENKLALVVGNLINNIITFAQDDCLHVCYLQSGEIVLRLENTNLSRNKSFIVSLEAILIIARRFGIGLKIEESYGKGSDVSVHFVEKAA
jgi:signal transduction histidine kinase